MTEQKQEYAIQVSDKIESVLMQGDLSKLSANERVEYYRAVCQSVGLNPLTRPFDYITLNGKLTLYAKKDATDQLRANDQVSITKLEKETVNDIYLVTAYASGRNGRTDASTGAVNIAGLKGDALANALMKAETKAKRRVTLSICGMGLLDETEIETIPDARVTVVDDKGEIKPELPETKLDLTPVPVEDAPKMSLELAETETNSKGEKYSDIDTEKLTHMFNTMSKLAIKTEDHVRKMEAIKTILKARAGNAA
jgi:hypothetical protein